MTGIWDKLCEFLSTLASKVFITVIKPLWNILTSWFNAIWTILALFLALFEMLLGLLEWVIDIMVNKVPVLANAAQAYKTPAFGSSTSLLAFANRFIPLQEAFDFLQLSLAIGGACLGIKICKWVWSIFRG